ncbi:uncharacterized protein JCM6883_002700 [Sporobolomyces salmoneus]|uniref:uncharacterized protein n=1 Tax=Sporobolomyces salmoneus TaxID=183962 RepID=UPI0031769CAB
MTTYEGPLNSILRPKLIELVKDLGVQTHNGYLSKYELTELVRATLKSDRSLRQDARFRGLWEHMPESQLPEQELERLVKENGAIEDPLLKAGKNSPFDPKDSHKSLDQLYHHHDDGQATNSRSETGSPLPSMREAILHPHIFDSLLSSTSSPRRIVNSALSAASQTIVQLHNNVNVVEEEVGPLALVPASRSLRRKASRSLSLVTKQSSHNLRVVARGSVAVVAEAQWRLSSAWFVILAIIFTEFSWIIYEALPWIEYSFGPYPSLIFPDVPFSSFHIPAFHLLLHPFFTFALIRYSFQTLLVPLLLSLIFAFPSSAPSSSSGRRRRRLSAPSPLIFSLTRLSIALLKGYILPSPLEAAPALHEIASHSRLALTKTLRTLLHEASATGYTPGLETFASSWRQTGWKGMVGGIAGNGGGERRWRVEEIVEGGKVWGVVALGMGVASVVSGVQAK